VALFEENMRLLEFSARLQNDVLENERTTRGKGDEPTSSVADAGGKKTERRRKQSKTEVRYGKQKPNHKLQTAEKQQRGGDRNGEEASSQMEKASKGERKRKERVPQRNTYAVTNFFKEGND